MKITYLGTAVLLALSLTACGGGEAGRADKPGKPQASKAKVDCSDQGLSEADWVKHCADEAADGAGTGGDGKPELLKFGKPYEWPDGLKATVKDAVEVPGEADEGETAFRLRIKLTNETGAPVDLDGISTIVDGATSGGTAAGGSGWAGERPLEGRLGDGVSQVFTDDNVLESRYGKKIVVTVQRTDMEFPEFAGAIKR